MKRIGRVMLALAAASAVAVPAVAADIEFHGDLNHRFNLYTNHSEFYSGAGTLEKGTAGLQQIGNDDTNTTWGDFKYRLWTEAKTNDGRVKGVYAVELGALRFGRAGSGKSLGSGYSGDGVNIETRWAYTAVQMPDSKATLTVGLQPYKVNPFLWAETAAGVKLSAGDLEVAWMRGRELFNSTGGASQESGDSLSGRYNLKPSQDLMIGLFGLYQHQNALESAASSTTIDAGKYAVKSFGDVDMNLISLGVDGGMNAGNLFVKWDAIYQTGEINNVNFAGINGRAAGNFDVTGLFVHADVGIKMGTSTLTYTTWYASGDDNDSDDKLDAYLATDTDRFDSIVLFEAGYNDDNYGTDRPYLLNKGMLLNKLAYDRKSSDRMKFGVAVLYLMTAEDVSYTDDGGTARASSDLGIELDAYTSYQLYPNVELALNGGYLVAGDAIDAFETKRDGSADGDIYRITSRIRYKF